MSWEEHVKKMEARRREDEKRAEAARAAKKARLAREREELERKEKRLKMQQEINQQTGNYSFGEGAPKQYVDPAKGAQTRPTALAHRFGMGQKSSQSFKVDDAPDYSLMNEDEIAREKFRAQFEGVEPISKGGGGRGGAGSAGGSGSIGGGGGGLKRPF